MNKKTNQLKSFSDSDICRNEAASQETELAKIIHCFYNSKFSPCSFTTNTEPEMENHYKKIHYQKEVIRG